MRVNTLRVIALSLVVSASVVGFAQWTETEGNDSKGTANFFNGVTAGQTITGNSTSPTGAGLDYFRLKIAGAPLGIYRHRLQITTAGPEGHGGSIRGLTQSAGVIAPTSDATFQSSSVATTPTRFNQWYGFGRGEELYYRVTGSATTTSDYVVTMTTETVTPVNLGSFQTGSFTITTTGRTTVDTEILFYDGNFDPISSMMSDDTGGGAQSTITGTLTPGTYYVAISNFNLANDQASPATDDFRAGSVLDFANIVANSSTSATSEDLDFGIIHPGGTSEFTALRGGAYGVYWGQMEVVPEPGSMIALATGLAGILGMRRRRRA